jgi:NAD(P)H-hydrate epimerase
MIVDADALNALAQHRETMTRAGGPRILTPHPGEFGRLVGQQGLSPEERKTEAVALARLSGAVIVLKGHGTLITDGTRQAVNTTGNPGMATGGTGDVLTGVILALVCQGLNPFEAAQLGVHVHGLAGDFAAADLGEVSLIARDLVNYLPRAFKR